MTREDVGAEKQRQRSPPPRRPHSTLSILDQLPPDASVVVIRLRSLGDTVLVTPALRLLKAFRPDLSITPVIEHPFVALLEENPDLADIVTVGRGSGSKLRAAAAIRRRKPALCLNLHGGSTSAWMTALSGARFKAGFAHFSPAVPYNVRIPRAQEILGRATDDPVHTAEHHASAMFFLGVAKTPIPRACLSAPAEAGGKPAPYAVVHVGAAYATKQWPVERFLRLGRFLRENRGLEPVMVAGPEQGDLLAGLTEFTCRGDLTVRRLKSLLAGAALFVGNDSGPAHMAAAFGIPSAVIFGSSDSSVWRPWRTEHEVIETDWDCKPCPGDRCYEFDEPRCILSVEVARVEAAIARLPAAGAPPSRPR